MPTHTITLELDAYEKLRLAKRRGETFSEVIHRAMFADPPITAPSLRECLQNGGDGVSGRYLKTSELTANPDFIPDESWA